MKRQSTIFAIAALLVASLLVLIQPAAAQDDEMTFTLTETQINESMRAQNENRPRFGPVTVDLQSGQAVTSGTYIPPQSSRESVPFSMTLVPSIIESANAAGNGNVIWTVIAVTVNGNELTEAQVDYIENVIASSFRRAVRENRVGIDVEAVVVSESDITYFYSGENIGAGAEFGEAQQDARLENRQGRQTFRNNR